MEPDETLDAGSDRVAVVVRQRAIGKGSGVPVDIRAGMIFQLQAERIVRVDIFRDSTTALKAAGLRG
jgi:hypothetical protein